jgi:hypothetical protein
MKKYEDGMNFIVDTIPVYAIIVRYKKKPPFLTLRLALYG